MASQILGLQGAEALLGNLSALKSNAATLERPQEAFDQLMANNGAAGTLAAQSLLPGAPANHFDVAVKGEGFFKVQGPQGDLYTKGGNFHIDSRGMLVNQNNQTVQPPVALPPDAQITQVKTDGTITYQDATGAFVTLRLQLFQFPNSGGLTQVGATEWVATQTAGKPAPVPASEVALKANTPTGAELAHQLVDNIISQRAYVGAADLKQLL